MSLLAALVLAAGVARVESVALTTANTRLAVRVGLSGQPGMVAVHREGGAARLSIMDAQLGLRFAGGSRFSWTQADGFDPTLLAATPGLERIELEANPSEVSVLLHVPPEISIDVRRDARGLLLVFRTTPTAPEPVRAAEVSPATAPPAPVSKPITPAPEPAPSGVPAVSPPSPPPAVVAEAAPTTSVAAAPSPAPVASPTPSPETAALAGSLFPAPGVEAPPTTAGAARVTDLYGQLFPSGAPRAETTYGTAPAPEGEVVETEGLVAGPFRLRASVNAGYIDADTFVESTSEPTRDRYLQVSPWVEAATPVGAGRLVLEYSPTFRAFATHDQVNSSAQLVSGNLELPAGPNVNISLRDRFTSGVLETRDVDPGGEYFFGLGRYNHNAFGATASIQLGPRMSVELGGAFGTVRFQEASTFFDYDTRSANAGLGFEMRPNLRTVFSYVYDQVPTPEERPEAEAHAHNAQATLIGDVLPRLSGRLSVGYRRHDSPNAGEGGQSYSGLTFSGALIRQLGPESQLTFFVNRSTPVSAFEDNAFYVYTSLQASLRVPLPAQLSLDGGVGYQWNDYRTVAEEIGSPREDRILAWFVGLRRPIVRRLLLGALYRSEERRSNVDRFDTNADGFVLQLEWDIFGTPRR